MIITVDHISENTRKTIREASVDNMNKLATRYRWMSIFALVFLTLSCLTVLAFALLGKSDFSIMIWPLLMLIVCVDAHRKIDNQIDLMKLALSPNIINEIRTDGGG